MAHDPNPVCTGKRFIGTDIHTPEGKDPRPLNWEDNRGVHGCVMYQDSWYFYNEVWTDYYGPFNTEDEADKALAEYCKTI